MSDIKCLLLSLSTLTSAYIDLHSPVQFSRGVFQYLSFIFACWCDSLLSSCTLNGTSWQEVMKAASRRLIVGGGSVLRLESALRVLALPDWLLNLLILWKDDGATVSLHKLHIGEVCVFVFCKTVSRQHARLVFVHFNQTTSLSPLSAPSVSPATMPRARSLMLRSTASTSWASTCLST